MVGPPNAGILQAPGPKQRVPEVVVEREVDAVDSDRIQASLAAEIELHDGYERCRHKRHEQY